MTGAARFWEEVHHWFDPSEPVAVDMARLHAERDPRYNPLVQLADELRLTKDHRRYLLTGAIGNGKTSELNFFANQLTESRIVVLVDLWEHIQSNVRDQKALDRLEMWELLGLIGVAIYQAGKEQLGHRWGEQPRLLEQALKRLRTAEGADGDAEIDLVELGRGMTVAAGGIAGIALAGASAASVGLVKAIADSAKWTWKVGLAGTRRRGDQDGEVRQVLSAVNELVADLRQAYQRPLLLVIDGLDRIRDPERTRLLFIDSLLLSELDCDELITAPLMLMREQAQLVDQFVVKDLYNIPVLDRQRPHDYAHPGQGLIFFRDLVARRVAWIRESLNPQLAPPIPLPQAVVDRLAYYSGGLARDFMKLIQLVALESLRGERVQADDEIVERALREARRDKEYYITKTEIQMLETIMADPSHDLPGEELALELLRQRRLLAYPNETTWYYPHPLLTLALLKPGRGSPS